MIPALISIPGAPFRVLPPGIHWSALPDIEARFSTNEHRAKLFAGFLSLAEALQGAGCSTIYLDGSFVTEKQNPKDYDGCWDPTGVQFAKLDPVLLNFDNQRAAQKAKYLGEMFPAMTGVPGKTFLDFFQIEKTTGQRKGIIGIRTSKEKPSNDYK